MKLNAEQINTIDAILEKLGVVYIDYKFEILDHIASEVEESMNETGDDFEKSLEIILKRWQPKLKKSSSTWFGYSWEMPEIMMQKALKLYKRKMLLLVALSMFFAFLIYFFGETIFEFYDVIRVYFSIVVAFQFVGYLKIRISSKKSTFGFLYKQQFLAFLFLYFQQFIYATSYAKLLQNPNGLSFFMFFIMSMLIISPLSSIHFYKEHFQQLKRNQKLI